MKSTRNHPFRIERQKRNMSLQDVADATNLGWKTIWRAEQGHKLRPETRRILCEFFQIGPNELGLLPKEEVVSEQNQTSDEQSPLYMLTKQQLSTFAALLNLGESIMFDATKRQTLEALLAAISVAVVQPQGLLQPESWKSLLTPTTNTAKIDADTIQGLKNFIDACWQLSRGNELALAEKLLPECMTRLISLAQQPSPYQAAAADLAAQGFRLYSIFALHHNDLLAREMYCKQAVQYSHLAGNQNLLIASLKGLADTYYYRDQHPQALQTYQDALQYTKEASPILQARVYMGLAVAYAHIAQKQDSLTYLDLAIDTFPDNPQADSSFFYADFDYSRLILWEGITRSELGQAEQALDVFRRIEQPNITAPTRTGTEIVNQQAKTAIVLGDLEQSLTYMEAGIAGAQTLGSQRRYNEAYGNFNQMRLLWPQEQRVKALGTLFNA